MLPYLYVLLKEQNDRKESDETAKAREFIVGMRITEPTRMQNVCSQHVRYLPGS